MHRFSGVLGGTGIGVKRRLMGQARLVPEDSEQLKMVKALALEGGLNALHVDFTQQKRRWQDPTLGFAAQHNGEIDYNAKQQCKTDLDSSTRCLKKASKGKAFPRWSAPLEGWLLALAPHFVSRGLRAEQVVGPRLSLILFAMNALWQLRSVSIITTSLKY